MMPFAPSRGRELKLDVLDAGRVHSLFAPSRGRELKYHSTRRGIPALAVRPLAGAGIEIVVVQTDVPDAVSSPPRGGGN